MLTQACLNICFYIYKVEKVSKSILSFKKNLSDLWISCHVYWKNVAAVKKKKFRKIFLKF